MVTLTTTTSSSTLEQPQQQQHIEKKGSGAGEMMMTTATDEHMRKMMLTLLLLFMMTPAPTANILEKTFTTTATATSLPGLSFSSSSYSSPERVVHRTQLEWPLLEEFVIEYPEFPLIAPNFLGSCA